MISLDAPKWRLIFTDSESLSGVAPVCPRQNDPEAHELRDFVTGEVEAGVNFVYECCPHPHIECWSPVDAESVLAVLNAACAEVCS